MAAWKESEEDQGIGVETGTATGTEIEMKKSKMVNLVGNTAIVTTTAGTVAIAHLLHNKDNLTLI